MSAASPSILRISLRTLATLLFLAAALMAQFPGGPQPEGLRQAQQLMRDGKMDEALAAVRAQLAAAPDSPQVASAAGSLLDLMGRGTEARQSFQKAIDLASTPAAKANAERAMAMSFAFDGDCKNTAKYEQMVFDYWVTQTSADPHNAWYQQGEMADEAARVCIDSGDLDTAYKYYKMGYQAGIREPEIAAGRRLLWEFRWEHAQARIAARRGNQAEAQKHAAAGQAALEKINAADAGLASQQKQFLPYLTGYVAFYSGDYKTALADFQQAGNDPFIQCMIGETYEKLGDKEKAMEAYRRAAATTAHNPPAAYARPFARKKVG
jgi:tetratricopeptide (TPR) repeat protein